MPEALWDGAGARFDRTGARDAAERQHRPLDRRHRRRPRTTAPSASAAPPSGAFEAALCAPRASRMKPHRPLPRALAGAAAAQPAPEATAELRPGAAAATLRVLGTTDVALFTPLLEAFVAASTRGRPSTTSNGARTTSTALAAAACRGEAPPADLVVSSAVDQQVMLVNDGCAAPHRSVATAALPPDANWRDELFGVTREPAVIVYNRDLVPAAEAPRSRFDLIDLLRPADSRYAGRVATYDIEASGLGYLFAFADSQQATTFGGLIEAFARSGADRHLLLGRDHRRRRRGALPRSPTTSSAPTPSTAPPTIRASPSSRPRTTPSSSAAPR